jgi:hypothetical protein
LEQTDEDIAAEAARVAEEEARVGYHLFTARYFAKTPLMTTANMVHVTKPS